MPNFSKPMLKRKKLPSVLPFKKWPAWAPEPPEAQGGRLGPRAGAVSEWSPAIKSLFKKWPVWAPEPPEAQEGRFGPRAGAASEWSAAIKSNSKTGRLGPQSLQRPRTAVLAVGPERPRNGPPLLKVIAKLAGLGPGASRGPGRPVWPCSLGGLRMDSGYSKCISNIASWEPITIGCPGQPLSNTL